MNKRLLSRIERPRASEDMIRLATRTGKDRYIATAELADMEGENILLLNFFRRSELVKGKTGAAFRTFISVSLEDYITQDLSSTRVKWKTGSLKSILGWYWWNTEEKGHDVTFASDADFIILKYYMNAYLEGENPNVWDAVWKFQDEVLDRRLRAKHKKETDKIDKKMEMVPQKPEGFEKWAHEVAMEDKRYLVYEAASKKEMTTGYCTYCKRIIGIDVKSVQPRNKKRGNCPNCGSPVTFIPKGYFPTYQRDNKWVCLMQKVPTGIVARYFLVYQEIERDNNYKESFEIYELCRAFLEEDNVEIKIDSYEWDIYKQHGLPRWCPDQERKNCGCAVVYTENLPEVFDGTFYRYCALDLYQKKNACDPIPVWKFMNTYPRYTCLEMFLKAGLVNLTGEIVKGNAYQMDLDGRTPEAILGISKKYISILREIDGSTAEIRLLKQCESDNILPQGEDIRGFCERFGGNDELIGVINGLHIGIRKFNKYMDKQRNTLPEHKEIPCHAAWSSPESYSKKERMREGYRNLAKDWLDYIGWSATLNYDTKDMYVLLPPDFGKVHDRVMKEYQAFKDEQERKRQAELERLIKKTLEAAEGIPAMMMKARGLMLILPKNGSEIKEEGRTLHHCVGSYVERVAKGETMILFVRKEAAPDVPYFTLEYRDGKVAQCRGKNNCAMTKDVKAFVQAFERKMQEEDGAVNSAKERRAG